MSKGIAWAGPALLASLIVAGCAMPVPPLAVNAVLPRNATVLTADPDVCAAADALVVAQCTRVEQYHSAVKGNWVRSWYLAQWHVLRIERGAWPQETVNFVFHDRGPTPESGIVLGAAPRVYYGGAVMAFCIDTSKSPPVIVAQQPRSRVPSHGTLRRPRYDPRDPQSAAIFQKVLNVARAYLRRTSSGAGALTVTEEYDAFFVVEVKRSDGSVALQVDKGSYRVTRIPEAFEPDDQADLGG